MVERRDIRDLIARPDALADLRAALGDIAGRRRANVLAQEHDIGVVDLNFLILGAGSATSASCAAT